MPRTPRAAAPAAAPARARSPRALPPPRLALDALPVVALPASVHPGHRWSEGAARLVVRAWVESGGAPRSARIRLVEADDAHATYEVAGVRVVVRPPGGGAAGWVTSLGVLSAA